MYTVQHVTSVDRSCCYLDYFDKSSKSHSHAAPINSLNNSIACRKLHWVINTIINYCDNTYTSLA